MEGIRYSNQLHHEIVVALFDFKILTTNLLLKEVNYKGNVRSFRKVIRTMVNKKRISVIRQSTHVPQYIFLDETKIDQSTMFHDVKLAEICLILRSHPLAPQITLSHHIETKNIIPDAIITFPHGKVYVELELTVKSETKILRKIDQYINTARDIQIFYFFKQERDLFRYKTVFESYLGTLSEDKRAQLMRKKFLFILDPCIYGDFNINKCTAHYFDQVEPLSELLRLNEPQHLIY